MLPRRLRLRRAAFPLGRQGARASSASFSLLTGPSEKGGCAVVISKAVAKRAVDRHLIKRRVLSVARPWCATNRFIVLYAKKAALTLPFPALKEEIHSLLSQALR